MTKTTDPALLRYVDHTAIASVDDLLDSVAAGLTVMVTVDGAPVARVEPVGKAGSPDAGIAIREVAAAYAPAAIDAPPMISSALARVIGAGAIRPVLGVFVMNPDRAIHQRELTRMAGVGLRSAQIALERLESLGLVSSQRDGNRRYYRARRSPRFEQLRALLAPEFGASGAIARALEPLRERISRAFIFGSTAEGSDTVESDLDLLVVGELSRMDLAAAIAQAQAEIGREIDLVLYRPADFAKRRAEENHFIAAVLAGSRIDVIGGGDDA